AVGRGARAIALCLFIHHPDGSIERKRSSGTEIVVGSDPDCDVVIDEAEVAAFHATIEVSEGSFFVTDRSDTGTTVGGNKVRHETVEFEARDVIELAGRRIRVQVVAGEDDSARPARPAATAERSSSDIDVRAAAKPAIAQEAPRAVKVAPRSPAQVVAMPPVRKPVVVAPPPPKAAPAPAAAKPASKTAVKPAPDDDEAHEPNRNGVPVAVRRRIHRDLIDNLDLARLDRSRMNDHLLRAKVSVALGQIVERYRTEMPSGTDTAKLVEEICNEAIGLGPLEPLLADKKVSEIMVIDSATIYIERDRKVFRADAQFTDEESVRAVLERIVAPLGRRIDESSPLLDARLHDGSRLNAVVRPLALRGTAITIRKFPAKPLAMEDLVKFGTVTERMARFLQRAVTVRKNLLISGGTGSGKTTLLNVLSAAIPKHERIVTIEDAAELRLLQPHVVSLESRPANMEGKGEINIRDLVKNAMRMRPDRIIVGECRGGEALDMLQAMSTGHAGSMTTTHANNPPEALKRIETLSMMSGLDMPSRALREQIKCAVELVVQQTRLSDGSRKITSIAEVTGMSDEGEIQTREIFGFRQVSTGPKGEVVGEFYATGNLPTFVGEFITRGLVTEGEEVV
ncbi:MAG TPA: ATPase, T2SS/T4P/T4SS family, partial [Polyangia bacterium]